MKSKSSQRSNLPGRNHGAGGVRQARRDRRPLPTPIPSCFEGWLQEENTAEKPKSREARSGLVCGFLGSTAAITQGTGGGALLAS